MASTGSTGIRIPRVSDAHRDAVENFARFHEAIREVIAWAKSIVDVGGRASPRDARWFRAFLQGPLAWHFADKDIVLASRLALRESSFLDACLAHASEYRALVAEAAEDLLVDLAPLCVGEPTNPSRYHAALHRFENVVAGALRYDDDVILPSAYTFLDPAERAALTREVASCDETRPWLDATLAGDAPVIHKVHAVRARTATSLDVVRSFADCPRRRAVAVDVCTSCPHLESLDVDSDGTGHVACAIDDAPVPIGAGPRVRDIMTRDVLCIEKGVTLAQAADMLSTASVSGLPVVDERGVAVGVLSQSDIVHAVHAGEALTERVVADAMMHAAFVVRETDHVEDAVRLLLLEGIHRLPVINGDLSVVGIVSTLDLLRATTPRARPSTQRSRH